MPSCAGMAARLEQPSIATTTEDGSRCLSAIFAAAAGYGRTADQPWRSDRGSASGSEPARLFYLVVSGGEIGKRHWNGDGFLGEVLKRYLQLLSRFQRGQHLGCDRSAGVAAPVFAGLDLQVDRLA